MQDDGPLDKGQEGCYANWKRICKVLLRNDYWCRGLSFGMHKSGAYEKYRKIMKKRRAQWGIMD
jgi:predicted phosphoadenosine phosphosulfate sulfurtransferase